MNTLDQYEYFLWSGMGGNITIRRGIPNDAGTGWNDTVEVASFNTHELGDQDATNAAFSLLRILQVNGRKVNWTPPS